MDLSPRSLHRMNGCPPLQRENKWNLQKTVHSVSWNPPSSQNWGAGDWKELREAACAQGAWNYSRERSKGLTVTVRGQRCRGLWKMWPVGGKVRSRTHLPKEMPEAYVNWPGGVGRTFVELRYWAWGKLWAKRDNSSVSYNSWNSQKASYMLYRASLPLSSWVTLDNSHKFSAPQPPHLWNRDGSTYFIHL